MVRNNLVCLIIALAANRCCGGDWPQILGPERNGHAAADEQLAATWPKGGPTVAWSYPLGSGYSGPAVAEGKVVVFHRVDDREIIEALDLASGRLLWKADFETLYRGGIDPDTGPRCVPLIAGDSVYVYGADGDLHSVDFATGAKRWSRSLLADYSGELGYFGAGSTPILVGGRLLVNVGGRGAGIVGIDPETGKTLWKSTDDDASYAAATYFSFNGAPQALFVTRLNCVVVDPKSGEATKLLAFGQRGPTVNAAVPLVIGNDLFLTASYGIGAVQSRLSKAGAKEVWANDDSLSSQYATPVEYMGHLYGTHGREDGVPAELRCVELATGKVKWSQKNFGVAHAILVDDKLLLQETTGRLTLAAADPKAYRELATHSLGKTTARALPALSGGRLLVRTSPMQGGKVTCFEVGAK